MPDSIRSVAVIVSGINQEYQSSVLSGIRQYAAEHGVTLCHFADMGGCISSPAQDRGEFNIYRLINYSAFDGVILMSNTVPSDAERSRIISEVRRAGLPAVVIDANVPGLSSLCIDNYAAMAQITEHVITEHGCSRIAYVSGPAGNPESDDRLRAFRDTVSAHELDPLSCGIYETDFLSEDAEQAALQILRSAAQPGASAPQAVICANDVTAVAVMHTLSEAGCRIPEDIIVTGFDGTYAGRNYAPELSGILRPFFETGYRACEMLTQGRQEQHLVLDTVLHRAQSCGCSKASTADSGRSFKAECYRNQDAFSADARQTDRMSCALAECDTPEQLALHLREFVRDLPCDSFYVCLGSDWAGDTDALLSAASAGMKEQYRKEGYPERMTALIAYENGRFFEGIDFPSRKMLPEPVDSDPEPGRCCYFLPLHFRDRAFGYCVICGNAVPISSPLLFSRMIALGNALEHVRKVRATNAVVTRLERLYILDPLSGIYNRNGFARETRAGYLRAIREQLPVMVMFADLDGLKQINDQYGHRAGDTAIRAVGLAVRNVCKRGEIYARFGGDEFLIFAVNATEEYGRTLAAAIGEELRCFNLQSDQPFTLSASIGFHIEVPQPRTSVFQMVSVADQKMYDDKKKKSTSKYLRR